VDVTILAPDSWQKPWANAPAQYAGAMARFSSNPAGCGEVDAWFARSRALE
jgi:hypothetical protein